MEGLSAPNIDDSHGDRLGSPWPLEAPKHKEASNCDGYNEEDLENLKVHSVDWFGISL